MLDLNNVFGYDRFMSISGLSHYSPTTRLTYLNGAIISRGGGGGGGMRELERGPQFSLSAKAVMEFQGSIAEKMG